MKAQQHGCLSTATMLGLFSTISPGGFIILLPYFIFLLMEETQSKAFVLNESDMANYRIIILN